MRRLYINSQGQQFHVLVYSEYGELIFFKYLTGPLVNEKSFCKRHEIHEVR